MPDERRRNCSSIAGRFKNSTVQHAVIDGYSSFLAKGHVPLFVLFLDVEPHRVDVNVHPTKREVRFADTEHVHQLVRSAVRQALGRAQVEASMAGSVHAQVSGHALFDFFLPIGQGDPMDAGRTNGTT